MGRWDRSRLEQVITNLQANAIKFGDHKPVELSVTSDNGIARLTVRDHGIGIAPDRLPHVFERFVRSVWFATLLPTRGTDGPAADRVYPLGFKLQRVGA
ncbi:ATP-binding protein [Archangium lansingense]|uniref:ATP-binding protein n=1 Tax=Archangium lansingense TaxID=2995310 RepID=UPI003B79D56C